MSTAPRTAPEAVLLTAETFARRPDPGYPEELVRGRIVAMPPPRAGHGQVCGQTVYLLRRFLEDHDLGHVVSNDTGVITERGPDTVRGADVAYYSYGRVPRGPLPESYLEVPPDVVFEVLSPDDRWPKVLAKVAEYLDAGVGLVVVLDPVRRSLQLFRPDEPVQPLSEAEELTLPESLPDFRVCVGRFFE
jgi:Uma2 family endonuclease